MNHQMTLNDFLEFCRKQGLSFTIHFSEAEELFEIWISSAAPSKDYYEKKVSMRDLCGFIERWKEHVQEENRKEK